MREQLQWAAICAAVTMALLLQAASGRAQAAPSEADRAEASQHFRRGAELFQEGIYRGALVELQRAYDVAPNYRVLYNIGQTHLALGEYVETIAAYEAFLEEGGEAIEEARRAELEREIAQLRSRIATLAIQVDRAGARIAIDGNEVGTSPLRGEVPVNVGRHRVSARSADGATASEEVSVAGGDLAEVRLTLVAPVAAVVAQPEGPAVAQPVVAAEPAERAWSARKKWAVSLLASAGATALAGGGAALAARFARDDQDDALSEHPGDPGRIADANDSLSRRALTADVLFGVSLGLATASVVLFALDRRSEKDEAPKQAKLRVRLSPTALVAEGSF